MYNISDTTARLKTNLSIRRAVIIVRDTNHVREFLTTLWDEGFILGYRISLQSKQSLEVYPKYRREKSVIKSLHSISKPSLNFNCSLESLWKDYKSFGLAIITTPQGVMSSRKCLKYKSGGKPIASFE